jgi:16S rRNA (cytidine1402-2'-O)-methyltransferase
METSDSPRGLLYLIPNTLGGDSTTDVLPAPIPGIVQSLRFFLAEDEKSARRLIKRLCPETSLRELSIERLNEHTRPAELDGLLAPLLQGHSVGVISEAGCPAIADPGSIAVSRAHELGITVRPLVGPCSMMLALMGSGLNGQRWRFRGYAPLESQERKDALLRMSQAVEQEDETQILMDTPYRNQRLFGDIVATCSKKLRLCIAQSLTTAEERIETKSIADWCRSGASIAKEPALFLIGK